MLHKRRAGQLSMELCACYLLCCGQSWLKLKMSVVVYFLLNFSFLFLFLSDGLLLAFVESFVRFLLIVS